MSNTNYKFNRSTFNPAENDEHKKILTTLRAVGNGRRMQFATCQRLQAAKGEENFPHRNCCSSSALEYLKLPRYSKEQTYLDIGCGESPDRLIAAGMGYKAIGVDLFAPAHLVVGENEFIKADAVDGIPLPDGSVYAATSQAMIDLIPIDERLTFYSEVFRVMAQAGAFSQVGAVLVNGYGFDNKDEVERVRQAGFRSVSRRAYGFLVVK